MTGIGEILTEVEIKAVLPEHLQANAMREHIEAQKAACVGKLERAIKERSWSEAVRVIAGYPEDRISNPALKETAEAVIHLWLAYENIDVWQIKKVNEALVKMGESLSKEPWKTKFIEKTEKIPLSKITIEDGPGAFIAAIKEVGLSEEEFIHALVKATEKESEVGWRTFIFRQALGMPFDSVNSLKYRELADSLFKDRYGDRAVKIYKELPRSDLGGREKIITAYEIEGFGAAAKVAKKLGIKVKKGC